MLSCDLEESEPQEKQPETPESSDETAKETVEQLLASDQPAEAAAKFEKESHHSREAAVAYGVALLRLGRTDEALRQLTRCRKTGPLACYLAGRILLQRGELKEAKAMFESAVHADGKDTRALNALAVVDRRIGDTAGARTALEKVLAQTPANLFATVEMADMGDSACAGRLDQFLSGEAQDWVYLALDHYWLGETDKAAECAKRAVEIEPVNVTAQAVLLDCAVRRNDSAAAKAALDAIGSVDVEKAIVYGGDDAVAALEETLRANPASSRLMLYLATAYQIRKSPKAASAMAAKASKTEPTLARAYIIQAQCDVKLVTNERDYPDVARKTAGLLDKCLALNPKNPTYYYNAAWLYGNCGRRRAMVEAMEKAVKLDPYCYSAYGAMGSEALNEKHDYAEAVRWFKLEANSPQHYEGQDSLTGAYAKWMKALAREKQIDKLREVLEESDNTPLSADRLDYQLARAEALEALGRHDESHAVLEALKAKKDDLLKNGWMRDWYYLGCAFEMLGDKDGADSLWGKCESSLEEVIQKNPDWSYGKCLLAMAQNKLGQHDEALRTLKDLPHGSRFSGYVKDAWEEIGEGAKF